MSVKSVGPKLNQNYNAYGAKKSNDGASYGNSQVAFTGAASAVKSAVLKAPVRLMDFIAAGGYAAAFIIQDGLGFVAPRVGKGLFRGGKERKDENGNVILDKNGKPKHELNWAYARKEGIREIITGPSAFIIPWIALKGINKYGGKANNIKLNYIDGFQNEFTKYAQSNTDAIVKSLTDKKSFYEGIYRNILENTINANPDAVKMTEEEIADTASKFADKQIKSDDILSDKSLSKSERKLQLNQLGSVESDFMRLKKQRIGSNVNEMLAFFNTADGKVQGGGIGEISSSLHNYFDDASNTVRKALAKNPGADVADIIKHFTNRRMGTRILTNAGLFLTVAAFFTQIPKLYNMGLKGNPALGEQNDSPALQNNKDVNFTGAFSSAVERGGKAIFNNKTAKKVSDVFELDGPIIQGSAMSVLLYGPCFLPRIAHAQDKYDYQEIVVRDLTAFTALLFGAKALGRLFSDAFTKITGLALNSKNLEGKSVLGKIGGYMSPSDTYHSVLSSKQLDSKYTNIKEYKDGVEGFMEFIEKSKGDIKKAFSQDKNVKSVIEKITGKSYKELNSADIKEALIAEHKKDSKLINDFYNIFKKENGLLNRAKFCNSMFGFVSTLLLVPGLIIFLTDFCKKMTEKQKAKDDADKLANINQTLQAPVIPSSRPTMAGFLNK